MDQGQYGDYRDRVPAQRRPEDGAIGVTAALTGAKKALEGMGTMRVLGEVSQVKTYEKTVYFDLKDDKPSIMHCMMWKNDYCSTGFELAVGQRVVLAGRFSAYAAKGSMSFNASRMWLAGEGDLRVKVEQLKRKLVAEGLADPSRKLALPQFPMTVGLVTSARGAAVHDVKRTLRRRFPLAVVYQAGVTVEGANAVESIIQGMRAVYARHPDVILVVRGGGSFDDLMPFNDEKLARAIYACGHNGRHDIPVVTGIGHEIDNTVADLVSDHRASTPTAAAEAVSPDPTHMMGYLDSCAASLTDGVRRTIERGREHTARVADRPVFRDPRLMFAGDAQTIDYAAERLARALPAQLERHAAALDTARGRMLRAGGSFTERFANEMLRGAARLDDLSLVNTLSRGYSMTRNADGAIVRHVEEAPPGSHVEVTVSDGVLECDVTATRLAE